MKELPHVTDHAVLRYLQRSMGLDVEAIRERIARECAAAYLAGARRRRADGVTFVLRGDSVVTVLRGNGEHRACFRNDPPLGGHRR